MLHCVFNGVQKVLHTFSPLSPPLYLLCLNLLAIGRIVCEFSICVQSIFKILNCTLLVRGLIVNLMFDSILQRPHQKTSLLLEVELRLFVYATTSKRITGNSSVICNCLLFLVPCLWVVDHRQ